MKSISGLTFSTFALSALCLFAADKISLENWTQWRGLNRDGVVTGKSWPEDLKENHLNLKWRMELGSSYSGPILDADTVYVTESADSNEVVRALDRQTGKEK